MSGLKLTFRSFCLIAGMLPSVRKENVTVKNPAGCTELSLTRKGASIASRLSEGSAQHRRSRRGRVLRAVYQAPDEEGGTNRKRSRRRSPQCPDAVSHFPSSSVRSKISATTRGAAAQLGLKRTSLISKMKRLGMYRPRTNRYPDEFNAASHTAPSFDSQADGNGFRASNDVPGSIARLRG